MFKVGCSMLDVHFLIGSTFIFNTNFIINPILPYPRTHCSILPAFYHSNWGEAPDFKLMVFFQGERHLRVVQDRAARIRFCTIQVADFYVVGNRVLKDDSDGLCIPPKNFGNR